MTQTWHDMTWNVIINNRTAHYWLLQLPCEHIDSWLVVSSLLASWVQKYSPLTRSHKKTMSQWLAQLLLNWLCIVRSLLNFISRSQSQHCIALITRIFCPMYIYLYVQCYQRREYILHVFTFLHVRCTNLHENQPDFECSYFGTSYIPELINGTFHASLPQIFA